MNNAIPARKSKLCTAAGIFFLIYAAINVLHLVIDYFIPGYPVTFSVVVSLIKTAAIAGLAIVMFAGMRNHAVTALFAIVAIAEIITFVNMISLYSDYGSGWGWATSICTLLGLVAAPVFAAIFIVKGEGVSNGVSNLWSLPGIFVLLATGVSVGVSAEYYFDTMFRNFFRSFSSGSFETIWENASEVLSTLIMPIMLGLGILFAIRYIQKPNLNSLNFSAPGQGFAGGFTNGGYNPNGFTGGRGYAQPGYNPNPIYNPTQSYGQSPNPAYTQPNYNQAPAQNYNPAQNFNPNPAPSYNPEPASVEPKIVGYDPDTGVPVYETAAPKIVGYDPNTGAPIYESAKTPKIVGYDPNTGVPIYE